MDIRRIREAKKGFTLIELLVVVAIIGILATAVVIAFSGARRTARDTRRLADMKKIRDAIELYYQDNGVYPPSSCGYDCNAYDYSYNVSWNDLAAALQPYIGKLPVDPINSACPPWTAGCYSYAYGNVGRTTYSAQYDLTAQLETPNHPQSCGVMNWRWYFDDLQPWCGPYSVQIYEASPT
jgi:type II secretion system protein G